jgi:LmbE family N-acetylglucosaminyl deacetylase
VITPITDDATWQALFAPLPELQTISSPLVVLAPHPDDETLGAGALIASLRARGNDVIVVAATDGENAYDTSPQERSALGALREREQGDALAALGVDFSAIKRLRMTDSGLAKQEPELTARLLEIVEPGMTLLAPWSGDFHPDHEACAHAAAAVAKAKSIPLISYFFWTWHRGTPELLEDLPLRRFQPQPAVIAAKARALSMHRSQLEWPDGEPILPERLLAPARWSFEVYLQP